jgi:hypothetical protein
MNNLEQYVEHCAGIYSFLSWMEKESDNGLPYEISNQIIYLSPLLSRYFSLGVSEAKKHKGKPFLAIQSFEAEWMYLVKWNHIAIRNNDNTLYFIAKTIHGDQEDYPDIPGFAIGIRVDTKEKLAILSEVENLIGREYFKDDTNEVHVNFHKSLFKLAVKRYEKEQIIVEEDTLMDYSQLLAMKEQGIQSTYSERPEFLGEVGQIEGTEELLKKWKKNEI